MLDNPSYSRTLFGVFLLTSLQFLEVNFSHFISKIFGIKKHRPLKYGYSASFGKTLREVVIEKVSKVPLKHPANR